MLRYTYKHELEDLVEWLRVYSRHSLTAKKLNVKVNKLAKVVERFNSEASESDKLNWMYTIDVLLLDIFRGVEGFTRMRRSAPDFITEHKYIHIEIMDHNRLKDIQDLGYRGLYEKYDAAEVRSKLRKTSYSGLLGLHKGTQALIVDIDHLNTTSGATDGLYIAIRDMSGPMPENLRQVSLWLSDAYTNQRAGVEGAEKFLHRLDSLGIKLTAVAKEFGIESKLPVLNQPDIDMEELDGVLDRYLSVIEKVHSELYFTRILEVI